MMDESSEVQQQRGEPSALPRGFSCFGEVTHTVT